MTTDARRPSEVAVKHGQVVTALDAPGAIMNANAGVGLAALDSGCIALLAGGRGHWGGGFGA